MMSIGPSLTTHRKTLLQILLPGILVLAPLGTMAQEMSNPLKAFKEERRFIFGIDNRRTHIKNQSTLIYGLYVGVGFGGKLRLKAGISGTPFERGRFTDAQGRLKKNRLIFVNLGEEFDFFILNRFRLAAYLQTGIGYNYYRYLDASKVETQKGRNLIIPIEMGILTTYDLWPWLRGKIGGGWRIVRPGVSADLSGYYVKIGLSMDTRKFLQNYRAWRTKPEIP
jgi:hypothetical protein